MNQVFAEGKSFNAYPLKLAYTLQDQSDASPAKVAVGASSRYFKKAVDRNRVKRLLRENYRLHKQELLELIPENKQVSVFILFLGKDLSETGLIADKMPQALQKLGKSFLNIA